MVVFDSAALACFAGMVIETVVWSRRRHVLASRQLNRLTYVAFLLQLSCRLILFACRVIDKQPVFVLLLIAVAL